MQNVPDGFSVGIGMDQAWPAWVTIAVNLAVLLAVFGVWRWYHRRAVKREITNQQTHR